MNYNLQPYFAAKEHVEDLMSYRGGDPSVTIPLCEILFADKIAYYPLFGNLSSVYSYYNKYSTRMFETELKANDNNNNVSAHFIHISSGGGEAWYLEQIAKTMDQINKPIYCLAEKICASAAYLIACKSTRVVCLTPFDKVGSIGTMSVIADYSGADEKIGIKIIEVYADRSDKKNKVFSDILDENTKDYVTKFLNPLQYMFEKNVRASRPSLNQLPIEHDVFRGEIYLAQEALDIGLIDGIVGSIDNAIAEVKDLVIQHNNNNNILNLLK